MALMTFFANLAQSSGRLSNIRVSEAHKGAHDASTWSRKIVINNRKWSLRGVENSDADLQTERCTDRKPLCALFKCDWKICKLHGACERIQVSAHPSSIKHCAATIYKRKYGLFGWKYDLLLTALHFHRTRNRVTKWLFRGERWKIYP